LDIIPVARFVFSLWIFGIMFYMFDNVLTFVRDTLSTTDNFAGFLLLMWLALPLINLFIQGILLLMHVQKRRA